MRPSGSGFRPPTSKTWSPAGRASESAWPPSWSGPAYAWTPRRAARYSRSCGITRDRGVLSLDEERLRILRLLEERRINAQEASDLLAALESREEREEPFGFGGERAPRLHIRIT